MQIHLAVDGWSLAAQRLLNSLTPAHMGIEITHLGD